MADERLTIRDVSKVFPGVVALDHVSMTLARGEILSLCGENGAGKSTLMKILSGTYPHGTYEGEIALDMLHTVNDAERCGIGIIPQELNMQLDMTVAENILLGHWPRRKSGLIDWKRMRARAAEALGSLQVALDPDLKMRSLNASMQQLVCIARTLCQNPGILILDEPTAALTPGETENLMRILRGLKDEGISCIYISHKLEEVFGISDRVLVMRNGRVVSGYSRAEIVPDRIIRDMIGREIDRFYPDVDKQLGAERFRVEGLTVPHPSAPVAARSSGWSGWSARDAASCCVRSTARCRALRATCASMARP